MQLQQAAKSGENDACLEEGSKISPQIRLVQDEDESGHSQTLAIAITLRQRGIVGWLLGEDLYFIPA